MEFPVKKVSGDKPCCFFCYATENLGMTAPMSDVIPEYKDKRLLICKKCFREMGTNPAPFTKALAQYVQHLRLGKALEEKDRN